MSLLEKLKHERDACVERYKRLERNLEVCKRELEQCDAEWGDFNVAIAALTPTPDFEAEKETAREQLEREPEIPEEGLGSSLIEMGYGDDDTPTEHISILAGDPAIEPEAGLHEERPALNSDMHDERELPITEAIQDVEAATQRLLDPEGYAPVVTPEAQMFSYGIQSEQKPKPDPRDWPFSNLFTGKAKVDA